MRPFAGINSVLFEGCITEWTGDISHGELIGDGYDETLTIDPRRLQVLYQGVDVSAYTTDYSQIPWRLGLLNGTN